MGDTLNILPARVAIGTANGVPVYASKELIRMFGDLLGRVGGTNGASTDDLALEGAFTTTALSHALAARLEELQLETAALSAQLAALAELPKRARDLELELVPVAPPTDWEHPGKIGAATANSGAFTTLKSAGKTELIPKDANVEIKPTGTGVAIIQPAAVGQVDNMELGKTVPQPARVTTLNKITFTQPATGATLTLADGATLAVPGVGGTLGSAAYANTGAFAARSATALAAVATDPASTQALANSLRAVLLSVGIGA
jgi:hypothetical protein